MLVLDTGGYDVILCMTWLSKHHAVIDCRNKKVIFRIPHQLEFQFIEECKSTGRKSQTDRDTREVKAKKIPVWDEFLNVFEEISGLPELWSFPSTLFQKQPHLQSTIPDVAYRIGNIEGTTAGVFRQKID